MTDTTSAKAARVTDVQLIEQIRSLLAIDERNGFSHPIQGLPKELLKRSLAALERRSIAPDAEDWKGRALRAEEAFEICSARMLALEEASLPDRSAPDAEPVAWRWRYVDNWHYAAEKPVFGKSTMGSQPDDLQPLYAAPLPAKDAVGEAEQLRAAKDNAYEERNKVVAALARLFPSGTSKTNIPGWSEDWHGCVYIDLPTGQVSWHYHDSQAYLFEALPPYSGGWDGHDTEEKYRRLAALAASSPPKDAQP